MAFLYMVRLLDEWSLAVTCILTNLSRPSIDVST